MVLQDRLANCGVPFLQAALHFLSDKLANGAVLPGSEGPVQVRASVTCCLAYQVLVLESHCGPCTCIAADSMWHNGQHAKLMCLQTNGKVTVTLEVIATLLRVLHEKVAVMPDGAAAALRQVHSQVGPCSRVMQGSVWSCHMPAVVSFHDVCMRNRQPFQTCSTLYCLVHAHILVCAAAGYVSLPVSGWAAGACRRG